MAWKVLVAAGCSRSNLLAPRRPSWALLPGKKIVGDACALPVDRMRRWIKSMVLTTALLQRRTFICRALTDEQKGRSGRSTRGCWPEVLVTASCVIYIYCAGELTCVPVEARYFHSTTRLGTCREHAGLLLRAFSSV
jgi:hypothetical protein